MREACARFLELSDRLGLARRFGFGGDFTFAAGDFALAMAELLSEAAGYEIDGRIEIMAVVFGVYVRSRKGDVDFDSESVFDGRLGLVLINGHVGSEDVALKVFKVADFLGDMGMNSSC